MNVSLNFFYVERAPAGAHQAPGAQTSWSGAQIEKNIYIYFFFPLERATAGAQKIYRENSQQFLSMESRHFDYIIASEKFNKFLEGKFNIFC